MSLRSNEFLKNNKARNENVFKLAVVTEIREEKLFITYHGEEVQSEKPYKKLSGSVIDVGDLVCIAKINNAGVILGKITTENSESSSGVPTNHATTATTYGKGTSSNYGHVKLSDSTSSTSSATSGGMAATPKAVKDAYDLANTAKKTAEELGKKRVASAYGSAASLSVPAKTITQITLDNWDAKSDSSFVFSNGGIKCPYDGYVILMGNIYYNSASEQKVRRGVYIYKNDIEIHSQYIDLYNPEQGTICSGTAIAQVQAGDVITLRARQSTAVTCIPNAKTTRLALVYI